MFSRIWCLGEVGGRAGSGQGGGLEGLRGEGAVRGLGGVVSRFEEGFSGVLDRSGTVVSHT